MNKDIDKYVFVTQLDPLYTYHFFNELVALIRKDKFWDYKKVIIYDLPSFNESILKNIIRFYDLYGMEDLVKLVSKYFYNKFIKRRLKILKKSLLEINIRIEKLDSVNSLEFKNILKKEPTNLISVSAPQIFSNDILNLKNCNFYNIHCAPLPSYKGMMPNFWQRYHNEQSTSVVLHKMTPKIDQGEVLCKISYPLLKTISLDQLMINSKLFSAHLFQEYFSNTEINSNQYLESSYFSFPIRKDGEVFKKRGGKFF